MNKILASAALALMPIAANAATIVTSFGTVTNGVNDADQAGPMFGQGITVNVGADTLDASIPSTVYLEQLSFQRTSSTTGLGTAVAYIHVYDAFTVDGDNTPSVIGNLVAVSSTTVDMSTIGASGTMTWNFGGDAISKSGTYYYILATDTNAATVGNSSNLATGAFELKTGNQYSGGQAYRANGTTSDWDMEFELVTNTTQIPEPSSAILGCLGVLLIFRRKRS